MPSSTVEIDDPGGKAGRGAHGHAGTLTITANGEAGATEFERCEAAASLICFRAANAVLFFEDELRPDDQARLTEALAALGSE